ncbi:hypothetical protein [Mycobacterium stomatepiae]|nr:hypothetical protein [Mycobacterium stomatepiae]
MAVPVRAQQAAAQPGPVPRAAAQPEQALRAGALWAAAVAEPATVAA